MEKTKKIKINNLVIKNYRSIENLELKPKQINVIVGKNNTGKSSILYAIDIFCSKSLDHLAESKYFGSFSNKPQYEINVKAKNAEISCNKNKATLFKSLKLIDTEKRNKLTQMIYKIINEKVKTEISEEQKLHYINLIFQYYDFVIAFFPDGTVTIRPYPIDPKKSAHDLFKDTSENVQFSFEFAELFNWLNGFPEINWEENLSVGQKNVQFVSDDLKKRFFKQFNEKQLIEFEFFLKDNDVIPNLERLTFDSIVTKSSSGEIETIPFEFYGDGTIVLINTLYYLHQAKNGILLIEEPENHLHPGFLNIFIDTIFKYSEKLKIQVFMTSHSYDLIEEILAYSQKNGKERELMITLMVKKKGIIEKTDFPFAKANRYLNQLRIDLRGI